MFFTTTSRGGCARSSAGTPLGPCRRVPMLVDFARPACLALLVAIAGCGRSDQERSQAAKVLRALEVVRAAPNQAKRRPADELAHEPCTSPVVCSARDRCAEAYHHLAVGTEAAQRVKD